MAQAEAASKASLFIGIRAVLAREGRLERVTASAGPALKALLERPPVASEWVSGTIMHELVSAIAAHDGLDAVQRITRRAVTESIVPLLRSYAGPMLRLFGATPHTIFSRLNDVMKLTNRGIDGGYRRGGDRRAFVSFCHPSAGPMNAAMFASWRGSLEAILDFCDARGTVSGPSVNAAQNGAEFELEWQ